jgi:hypothetical protein
MQIINPHKAGLAFGGLMGSWHLFWALLVALGLAQPLIDFIFWMHFIKPIYVISPFNIGTALVLIGTTSLIGYALGMILAGIWNFLQR